MKLALFTMMLFSLVFTGCTVQPFSVDTTMGSATPVSTPRPPSFMPSSPLSPGVTPLNNKCISMDTKYPTGTFSGMFVFLNLKNELYGVDLRTRQKSIISSLDTIALSPVMSPNGQHLAYLEIERKSGNNQLVLMDLAGERHTLTWESDWAYLQSWLDDSHLLIHIKHSDNPSSSQNNTMLVVVNPFSGEQKLLQLNLPNLYSDYAPIPHWAEQGETSYSPALDRVVYLIGEPAGAGSFHYILWNITEEQETASFEVVVDASAVPRWSPTGDQFAFAPSWKTKNIQETWPSYELYLVDKQGQKRQITHLTQHSPWTYIDNFGWSPDGKKIAFWFSSWEADERPDFRLEGNRLLAIVDTETSVTTNYCLQVNFEHNGKPIAPIWSIDGQYLIVKSLSSQENLQIALIDFKNRLGYIIIQENVTPIGWMMPSQ